MAKRELYSRAIEMRLKGMSYSQIRLEVRVSKSTLSAWLSSLPLSDAKIRELRGNNIQRIERYRKTRAKQKSERLEKVYEKVGQDIGNLSPREVFLCGLFLYWGEGNKTKGYTVALSNTDPAIILYFKKWLELLGVRPEKIKVRLQLYTDMNIDAEIKYWSSFLDIPRSSFRKSHIKSSTREGLTYKQKFSHGTCNLIYDNRDIAEYVHSAMDWMQGALIASSD